MKKTLIIAFLFALSFGAKAKADELYVTASSAVFVTSTWTVTIIDVQSSTGVTGTYYVLIDSRPLATDTPNTNLGGTWNLNNFPVAQWITPQIPLVQSTASVNVPNKVEINYKPRNGLVIIQPNAGTNGNAVIRVRSRKEDVPASRR